MSPNEIIARYDGYRGAPCNPTYTKDQRAARLEGYRERLEGYRERNRQDITNSQAGAVPLTDEQIQDLLLCGNPTDEEMRLIRIGWEAAHGIKGENHDR